MCLMPDTCRGGRATRRHRLRLRALGDLPAVTAAANAGSGVHHAQAPLRGGYACLPRAGMWVVIASRTVAAFHPRYLPTQCILVHTRSSLFNPAHVDVHCCFPRPSLVIYIARPRASRPWILLAPSAKWERRPLFGGEERDGLDSTTDSSHCACPNTALHHRGTTADRWLRCHHNASCAAALHLDAECRCVAMHGDATLLAMPALDWSRPILLKPHDELERWPVEEWIPL